MNWRTARVAPEKAAFRPALPLCSLPGMTEMHMATMPYKDQYLHPNWQRRRLECLEAAGWACKKCECEDVTLHVHHKRYVKGRMVWEYENSELVVLCEDCHASEHALRSLLDRLCADAGIYGEIQEKDPVQIAVGLIAGFFSGHFAGHVDVDLVTEARAVAPSSFTKGLMVGAASGVVLAADMAKLIRESHEAAGIGPTTEAEQFIAHAEASRPSGSDAPR